MSEVEELLAQLDALFAERRFADAIPYARRWTQVSPTDWRAYSDLVVALKHARDFAGGPIGGAPSDRRRCLPWSDHVLRRLRVEAQ